MPELVGAEWQIRIQCEVRPLFNALWSTQPTLCDSHAPIAPLPLSPFNTHMI